LEYEFTFFFIYINWEIQRKWYIVTVCLIFPDFGYNIFKLAVSTDSSQGIYSGIESRSARNSLLTEISQLTDWLYWYVRSFLHSSPRCQRNKPLQEKSSKNIPTNNEHLRPAGHSFKQKNTNLIWKRGETALYSYSLAGARVDSMQTKINFALFFQYKLANAKRPVYLLIFLTAFSEIWTTDPVRLKHGIKTSRNS
jgi:hypothetical protein